MKSFFIKVFMMIAAGLCMLEGLVLVAVGLGRLPSDKLMEFYNNLLATPRSLTTVLGVGAFFVVLGFILLIFSARTRPAPHVINVEKDGKPLSIPEKAIRSFILQIIEQSPCASDVGIEFEHGPGDNIEILVAIGLDGVSSIYEELNEIEQVLKAELDRVFEWKNFKITFHLRGVGVDKTKKYFASAAAVETKATVEEPVSFTTQGENITAEVNQAIKAKIIDEEEPIEKEKDKPIGEMQFLKNLFGEHKAR
ncbi:MAG: hypothetical protein HQL14_00745 [Candidatus Omnitrophica bacterium]|nr:hypothetical protein [Candidatus Omnitrophota bacterium]